MIIRQFQLRISAFIGLTYEKTLQFESFFQKTYQISQVGYSRNLPLIDIGSYLEWYSAALKS